jgi:hypothetical protein
MRPFRSSILSAIVLLGAAASGLPAAAETLGPIQVVSAVFGPRNDSDPLDFSKRLQASCGDSSTYCDAFCSEASVGAARAGLRPHLGWRPICRVVYRCGEQTTRTTEAARNETFTLNCRPMQPAQ